MSTNNPQFLKEVDEKVQRLVELRRQIRDFSEELRTKASFWIKGEDPCPLQDDHYDLSKQLVGIDSYEWKCPFCGKSFCE